MKSITRIFLDLHEFLDTGLMFQVLRRNQFLKIRREENPKHSESKSFLNSLVTVSVVVLLKLVSCFNLL